MEVQGKIKLIKATENVGSNGFTKREMVVTTEEQYPQHILIQFVQDKCDLLNNFQVGQDVKVGINLRGREWTNPEGKVLYFNSIVGWRIDGVGTQPNAATPPPAPTQQAQTPAQQPTQAFQPATNVSQQAEDDLPF